jgi:7,8-dihydropterin-6-yl-methyl-4-(beta-D-ribofuranosyl)aminobenzene 5'-phosphate synthase
MDPNSQGLESRAPRRGGCAHTAGKLLLYALGIVVGLVVVAAAFVVIRQAVARGQIAREWQAAPAALAGLQPTTALEVLPIYDVESAAANIQPGYGVSYLVRTDTATVLLDLGNKPDQAAELPAVHNLAALGVDWAGIDAIVISHPHPDHVGGTAAWQQRSISFGDYTGDLSRMPVYTPIEMTYAGASLTHSAQPVLVASDIATTGVIPYPEIFPLSVLQPIGHEQALVVNVAGRGLVLITGCGHPTLEKLVTRAESLFGLPVVGVVGGLHLQQSSSEALQPGIELLQARNPGLIALSPHDSSAGALAAFQSAFPDAYHPVRVGEAIRFP